jgi:hypothetical protein
VTVIRESRSVDIARNHTPGANGDASGRALDTPIEAPQIDASAVEDSPIQAA